jgi:hypothetical protein
MMRTDDLENELRNLKFAHLDERELVAFCDQELDEIGRVRAEAHLKQCFICERRVALLLEESAALGQQHVSDEDVALVERLMEQVASEPSPSAAGPAANEIPLQERLAEYLRLLAASLQIAFTPTRRAEPDEAVWSWQTPDGRLQARAIMQKNADMVIHFSSNEMELEGAHLRFRRGALNQETTLRRVSESEVGAQITVPWEYRQHSTADIFIEII